MAFTGNYSCNTLRSGLANGTINFASDTFYLALYTNAATLDSTTTAYTTTGAPRLPELTGLKFRHWL